MWNRKKGAGKDQENRKNDVDKRRMGITLLRLRRMGIRIGWCLLIFSLAFAVYKNFTAIDTVTFHEKETIVEKVENYSGVESFTQNFAKVYFTYSTDSRTQAIKKECLEEYMQKSLVQVNQGDSYAVEDITVNEVQIWSVQSLSEDNEDFEVVFIVSSETEKGNLDKTAYRMNVHAGIDGYVVTKNPTVTSMPGKSEYEAEYLKSSDLLGMKDREAVEIFLNTFFNVYPKATEKELAYYVKDSDMKPINKDYELLSIDNLAIQVKEDQKYNVECYVSYMDNSLGVRVLNQYQLDLATQEDGELIVTKMQ